MIGKGHRAAAGSEVGREGREKENVGEALEPPAWYIGGRNTGGPSAAPTSVGDFVVVAKI